MEDGAKAENIIMFGSRGTLHAGNEVYKNKPLAYRQWEMCLKTNPKCITDTEEAFKDADIVIAASKPGPNTIKPEWISLMADKSIVFACANPVPEIYPYAAKEAGAYIVATGRGDFPNQVNNSVCFPSILKGTLLVQARKISDGMAITAAHAIADFAYKRGINPENIIPKMSESDVFPYVAAEVAQKAIEEGLARIQLSREEVYNIAKRDIEYAHNLMALMMEKGFLPEMPVEEIEAVLQEAITEIKNK